MKKISAEIICIEKFKARRDAGKAIAILRKQGIRASTKTEDFRNDFVVVTDEGIPVWVYRKDSRRAHQILVEWARRRKDKRSLTIPPEEGTLGFLDMLIHDCRQYLMIATGELKSIDEEGELELDEPTDDIEKITIRLKRLKDQCMRLTGRTPLDWQR